MNYNGFVRGLWLELLSQPHSFKPSVLLKSSDGTMIVNRTCFRVSGTFS